MLSGRLRCRGRSGSSNRRSQSKPWGCWPTIRRRSSSGGINGIASWIVAARGDQPYGCVDELRRPARVPPKAQERLGETDSFQGLGLNRRVALWAIRGLKEDVLRLFAVADAGRPPRPEFVEPSVALSSMSTGRNVVEDYASVGLTLRRHAVGFLRGEPEPRGIVLCDALSTRRDGRRVTVAGLVPVRRQPASGTGVIFKTKPASPTCSGGKPVRAATPRCHGD